MKEIQIWLGHSDMATTADLYTHIDDEMTKNTGDKINYLFSDVDDDNKDGDILE